MAIAYVGAGTFASGTTSPLAPTLPAHSEGDFILVLVTDRTGSGADVTVSGYECLGHFPTGQFVALPNGHAVWLFGKVAGPSESTPSVVADASVAAGWGAQCFVYSGVAGLDTGARWNTNNRVAGNAAPPQTRAAADGAWVVAFGASFDDNTLGLLSGSEQGYTLRASNNGTSSFCMALADKALTSAGDTQVGPTFEQTTAGTDTWISLGQLTLLPSGTTPNQPRLMRQLYGLGSAATTEQTMLLRYDDLQADDLILVWVGTNATTSTLAVSGFTQEIHADGTTTRSLDLFYKVATGAETSVAITNPEGGFAWEATVQIWRGVDTSTPFDVANTENNAASGATFAGPSITPTTDHAVVISAAALQAYPANPAFSNAQGFQPSFLGISWQTNASFGQSLYGGDKYVASAAATTAPTWSGSSSTWVGASTALRPAAGGPIAVAVGTATEAETALPVSPVKPITVEVGTAQEAESALPVAAVKPIIVQVGQASEAEAALGISPVTDRIVGIGVVSEAETALTITPSKPITVPIGQASETELALGMTIIQPRVVDIGQAAERELALTVSPRILVPGKLSPIVCDIAAPTVTCATAAPTVTCSTAAPSITCTIES